MSVLHVDFETRGSLDLREVGLHRYARHPDTDVWCMGWAIDDEGPYILPVQPTDHDTRLASWVGHVKAGGPVVAHNAPFELEIWNQIMVPRYGWPILKPEQTYCTMAMAYAMGLPGSLEEAAPAAGIKLLKDAEGRALMLRMARPRRIENGKPIWWDEKDKLERLYEYCKQDVRVERELYHRLRPLSASERKVWLMDYAINQRGVAVDLDTAKAAIAMTEKVKAEGNAEIAKLTGGAVQTHSALIAMKSWIADQGVAAESLTKQTVSDLMAEGVVKERTASYSEIIEAACTVCR